MHELARVRPRQTPWLIGWEAAQANAAPAFVLQTAMLALLLAYYFHPPIAAMLNALANAKRQQALAFVLVASVSLAQFCRRFS